MSTEQAVLNAQWNAAQEAQITAMEQRAPHVLMRPRIFPDGDQWCALYGEDLQMGVAGFGNTPEGACADFDRNWQQTLRPALASQPKDSAAKATGEQQ
jgi:hypothetical protein